MTMAELLECCGSIRWAEHMATSQPFGSTTEMLAQADRIWWSLDPSDWLDAFRAHPRIGEKKTEEQAGMDTADALTVEAMARGNAQYFARFGYIYIVCAAGKSGEEMLSILQARLQNAPDNEIRIAAAEQAKITRLRLQKRFGS